MRAMKDEISVSEFKATCLKIIEDIRRTGRSVIVTKNGEAAVKIIPAPAKREKKRLFGALQSEVIDVGDILTPLGSEEWEVFK